MSAQPLAEVRGREAIEAFWTQLIEGGYANVRYLDPKVRFESDDVAYLSSPWAMNRARGMIHEERWERHDGRWLLADDRFEILDQVDATREPADVVLVHGAWMGAWCWDGVRAELERKGLRVHAVELPGHGDRRNDDVPQTLDVYAETVVEAMRQHEHPVALVGHSFGGVVISRAAELAPERVRSLTYLSAFLLPAGSSFLSATEGVSGSAVLDNLEADADGVRVRAEALHDAVAHDVPRADFEAGASLLVPEPRGPLASPLEITRAHFGRVPRHYIECTEDRAVPLSLQRGMHGAWIMDGIHGLSCSHAAMLSRPVELASTLADIAAQ